MSTLCASFPRLLRRHRLPEALRPAGDPALLAARNREGIGGDWPIRYEDLVPWYSYVEKYIGVSGSRENLAYLPDSEFQPPMPTLILPSVQVNMRAGHLPEPESNGIRYLKIPLNVA